MGSSLKGSFVKWLADYICNIRNGEKKLPKDALLVILLSGILLYVISIPSNKDIFLNNDDTINNTTYLKQEQLTQQKSKAEMDLEEFLSSIEGVGKVKALIYFENQDKNLFIEKNTDNKISGVVIAAEGAESEVVRGQIIHLVMVLYGLEIDNVEVFVLKK